MNSLNILYFLIIYVLIHNIISQDLNIPNSVCEDNTLKYSIAANLTKYLNTLSENNSEIENKTTYSTQRDLLGKKAGVVKGTIYEYISKKNGYINNFTVYDTYEDAQNALNNHSIDYFVCYKEIVGDLIQMYTENLTYISVTEEDDRKEYESGFIMLSNNTKLRTELEMVFNGEQTNQLYLLMSNWLGVDEGLKYINKTANNPTQNLSILVNFNQQPFAYKENNEQKGLIVNLLYGFANALHYNLELKETNTVEDFIPAVKNGSVNASVGYVIKEEISNDDSIYLIKTPVNATTVNVIRYDDSINSTVWEIPNSIKDFDGEYLGCLEGEEDLLISLFPESEEKIDTSTYSNELFNLLLKEDIDGILLDKIILNYYLKNNDRVAYYEDILANNSYGFSFINETLKNEFNEFLNDNYNEAKLNELFNEWKEANSAKKINEEYTNLTGNITLEIAFPNIRPVSYLENGIYKGYELDLLYRFAKEKGYKIEIIQVGEGYIPDVYIGCRNITTKDNIYFSNPILNSSSVLAVRKDSIRSRLPITVLNGNYSKKTENKIEIPVNVSGIYKNSSCIIPDTFYNDTILINCTISDLSEDALFNGTEINYGHTDDRINLLYASIKAENLIKANNIFSDNSIITHSNTNGIICPNSNNSSSNNYSSNNSSSNNSNSADSSSDDSNSDDSSSNSTINKFNNFNFNKKKKGLSTGGIIGIIIPCAVVLIGISIAAFACRNKSDLKPYPSSSYNNLSDKNIIVHP